MATSECSTYWVKIYIAGPIEVAKNIIRLQAKRIGMCVTIEPTQYVYSGGEEAGYVVGFIKYPRFPADPDVIYAMAEDLARTLRAETGQDSFTIMDPSTTKWVSSREE